MRGRVSDADAPDALRGRLIAARNDRDRAARPLNDRLDRRPAQRGAQLAATRAPEHDQSRPQLRSGLDDHVGRAPALVHSDLGVDPSALEVLPKLIEGPGDVVLAVAPGHDEQRRPGDTLRSDAELDRL